MAEGTRVKELLEAQRKMDQVLQAESMKRSAAEEKLQEQIISVDQKMEKKMSGIESKYDHLATTLADIKLQLGKDKGSGILGPSSSSIKSRSNTKSSSFKSNFKTGGSLHRVDFHRFNGENPRGWMIKYNSYFTLTSSLDDEHMVQMAIHNFEGKALQWLQSCDYEHISEITW